MTAHATSTLIDQLVQDKEYRIVSAPLMRHVVATSTLGDGAKVLWFSLWELCAMEAGRRRRLTLGFLAQRLGKSVATIRRYVNQLRKNGYVVVEERFDDNQGQIPSIYQVTAPTHVVAMLLKEIPNRKPRQDVDVGARTLKTTDEMVPPVDVTTTKENGMENIHSCGRPCVDVIQTPTEKIERAVDVVKTCVDQIVKTSQMVDVASTGKSGSLASAKSVSKLEERLNRIRERSVLASEKRSEEIRSDIALRLDRCVYAKIEDRPETEKQAKNQLEGEGGKVESTPGCKSATQGNIPQEENNKEQSQPSGLRFWVYRQIKKRGAFKTDPWRYVDEIVTAIEKGSLKKFELTKALNIALKLIREGRWTAPRFVV